MDPDPFSFPKVRSGSVFLFRLDPDLIFFEGQRSDPDYLDIIIRVNRK